jgi:hypothetical protein
LAAAYLLGGLIAVGQTPAEAPATAAVHFDNKLRDWDGFGVNYVEVCQTRDYSKRPQDYGGLSRLSEKQRQEVEDLVFGPDGLKPALVKMFLDPFHEGITKPAGPNDPNTIDMSRFDHKSTTQWTRYFVREGLKRTRARGDDLQIITTLYSAPAWTLKQKFVCGRDIDPAEKEELAKYMISWVKYLRDVEHFPVKYLSLHNEGEKLNRWKPDGSDDMPPNTDYVTYWPAAQVVDFLRFMRPMMDHFGLQDVGLAPGETAWGGFTKGYAPYIAADPVAVKNLGLISGHGFNQGLAALNPEGTDMLRKFRPELHAWTASMGFAPGRINVSFIEMVRQNIYVAKVNGVIPWSVIQSDYWRDDPNLKTPFVPGRGWSWEVGKALWEDGKGGYTIEPDYYLYKQVSRAGQAGMAVAEVSSSDPNIGLMAFARNGTRNPDALVIHNLSQQGSRNVAIRITGTGRGPSRLTSREPARTTRRWARLRFATACWSAPSRLGA